MADKKDGKVNMDKTIPELFAMLKAAEVEIKKEHQVLMVNKTTSFKKRAKGLSASTAKGLVTGSGTAPSIWRIRRMAK